LQFDDTYGIMSYVGLTFLVGTGVFMVDRVKLKRGQKQCKSCGAICASRSSFCKTCNKPFISKNTPIKNEIKDWESLEKGVRFKVIQGTGSYFLCKRDSEEGKRGEKIYMGARGVYTVKEIIRDGILACGQSRKNSGIHFIYMGKECYIESTGITRKPHRLVRTGNKRKRKKV
jgi:hypothetical protein